MTTSPDPESRLVEESPPDSPSTSLTPARVVVSHTAAALEQGDFAAARSLILERLGGGIEHPSFRTAAAQILYLTRDFARSMQEFRGAADAGDSAALSLGAFYALSLGWYRESHDFLVRIRRPGPDTHRVGVALYRAVGDFERALFHAVSLTEAQPVAENWLALAEVRMDGSASSGGSRAEIAADLKRAVTSAPSDGPTVLAAARLFLQAGMVRPAQALLRQLLGRVSTREAAALELAELELWFGRTESATGLVAGISGDVAETIRGAASLLDGRPDDAVRELSLPVAGQVGSRIHLWRAEAFHRTGRDSDALRSLAQAAWASDGFVPALGALSALVSVQVRHHGKIDLENVQQLLATLAAAGHVSSGLDENSDRGAVIEQLECCLGLLSGNRTPSPTILIDGRIVSLPALSGVRSECAEAVRTLTGGDYERTRSALEALRVKYSGNAHALARSGELELWTGKVERARRLLREALAASPDEACAWAALAYAALADDDAAEALRLIAEGVVATGREDWAYGCRGEALAALGRADEAVVDLALASEYFPSFGHALALVVGQQTRGNDAVKAAESLIDTAPGLFSDAAADLGVTLHRTGTRPENEHLRAVCAHALQMLSGNRSSLGPTYVSSCGAIRSLWTAAAPALGGISAPSVIDEILRRVSLIDARGLPQPLTNTDVSAFIENGWVKLEGAFERSVAAEWRTRAVERIRREADKCVRGHESTAARHDEYFESAPVLSNESPPDLSCFDPSDPTTWGQDRIDYAFSKETPFVDFSPRLWGAVNQLIGIEQLRTQNLGEYLILNLSLAKDIDLADEREWSGWHLDAPKNSQSLDNIEVGLLLVLLFSDIGPNMGATAIAPDSVGFVSRRLAESDGPVDFVSRPENDLIMEQSDQRKFLTGQAGDAYLLHPLLMHSVSPNPSGIIRWMTNPVLFAARPLEVAKGRSAVEQAIRNAITV